MGSGPPGRSGLIPRLQVRSVDAICKDPFAISGALCTDSEYQGVLGSRILPAPGTITIPIIQGQRGINIYREKVIYVKWRAPPQCSVALWFLLLCTCELQAPRS